MKKLNITSLVLILALSCIQVFGQTTEIKEKKIAENNSKPQQKEIKIDLKKIPNSILVTLRDTYAKYFVMKAYKTDKLDDVYFLQLQKNRKWFTVAVTVKGRVLKEIHPDKTIDENIIVDKN